MREWSAAVPFGIFVLAQGLAPMAARAADMATVLVEITDTADRLCGYVGQSGHASSAQISGDVKAELNGLAKRLADLGITGTGGVSSTEYEGVVQQELTTALQGVRDCKIRVFETLQSKLIAPAAAPAPATLDPDTIYQLGASVGRVQSVVEDLANGTINYGLISGAMYLDVTRDFRYRNYILHIERFDAEMGSRTAPAPQGQWLERRLARVVCRVVGVASVP